MSKSPGAARDGSEDAIQAIIAPGRLTRVVDVGANPIDGDPPYKPMLSAGLCEVVGFEPNPGALAALERRKGPNETYLPFALGDGGRHVLHLYRASGFTSLLEIRPEVRTLIPSFRTGTELRETIDVPTRRMDDCAEIPEFDFLKIDIQGAELSVLQNGRSRLSRAVAVQIEVSFLPLYRDQPGLGAIDTELRNLGFLPHMFAALKKWLMAPILKRGRRWDPINQLLEGDLVFFRDFTRPDLMTEDQLRHLAMIAHYCYGSFDVAAHCLAALDSRSNGTARRLEAYVEALPDIYSLPRNADAP